VLTEVSETGLGNPENSRSCVNLQPEGSLVANVEFSHVLDILEVEHWQDDGVVGDVAASSKERLHCVGENCGGLFKLRDDSFKRGLEYFVRG